MNARGALGRYGEDLAARLLADAGMTVLERNWRCRAGEIDIVARDGDAVVVCEVKTRTAGCFEHPMAGRHTGQGRPAAQARRDLARPARRAAARRGPDRSGRGRSCPARRSGRRACAGRGLMGFARACSVALVGVEGVVVEVQADLEPGVAAFTLVGLPDKSLVESRDRVRAAVVNSGAEWPQKKLTVGLLPGLRTQGRFGFRSRRRVRGARCGGADRSRGHRRRGDDRGARPRRQGAPGARGAARSARGGGGGVPAGGGPRADAPGRPPSCPGVSVLGVRSLRQLIAVLGGRTRARGAGRGPGPPRLDARRADGARRGPRHRAGPAVGRRHGAPARPGGRRGPGAGAQGPGGGGGRADTICCSPGRPGRGRRCWPSGSRRSCRR